jgi:hypothetical protein
VLLTHYFDFKSAVLDHPTNVDIIEVDTYSAADGPAQQTSQNNVSAAL